MRCILLAAGYATRLYPLTKDKPKSLLEVGDSSILTHIVRKIECVDELDEIYIVTNDRFYALFQAWVETYSTSKRIKVVNDHTTTNENRLGAIADIQYVLEECHIAEDILVMAGDNLFEFDLRDFVAYYQSVDADCITVHELADVDSLRKTGVVETDRHGLVVGFEEKPLVPKSNLAVPPFYIYKADSLPLIKQYLDEGNNPDAPGHLIPWLIQHRDVYAYYFAGERYDIGTLDSYVRVREIYGD